MYKSMFSMKKEGYKLNKYFVQKLTQKFSDALRPMQGEHF